eukprot:14604146-Ditylum_brightwellii.AAC.1
MCAYLHSHATGGSKSQGLAPQSQLGKRLLGVERHQHPDGETWLLEAGANQKLLASTVRGTQATCQSAGSGSNSGSRERRIQVLRRDGARSKQVRGARSTERSLGRRKVCSPHRGAEGEAVACAGETHGGLSGEVKSVERQRHHVAAEARCEALFCQSIPRPVTSTGTVQKGAGQAGGGRQSSDSYLPRRQRNQSGLLQCLDYPRKTGRASEQ